MARTRTKNRPNPNRPPRAMRLPASDIPRAARFRDVEPARVEISGGTVELIPARTVRTALPLVENPNRGKRGAAPAGATARDPESQVRAAADRVGNLRIVSPLLDTGGKRRGRSTLRMAGSWDPPAADVAPPTADRPRAMREQVPHEQTMSDAEGRRIARRADTARKVRQYRRGL